MKQDTIARQEQNIKKVIISQIQIQEILHTIWDVDWAEEEVCFECCNSHRVPEKNVID